MPEWNWLMIISPKSHLQGIAIVGQQEKAAVVISATDRVCRSLITHT